MQQSAEVFKALGDETRLRIACLLAHGGRPLCLCELVDSLEVTQYNISRHLKVLEQAGLVERLKEGRWAYFTLSSGRGAFGDHLRRALLSLPQEAMARDRGELSKRLAMRTGGKCTLGIQKARLRGSSKDGS
jgi:ArsR family transcriptional regulator